MASDLKSALVTLNPDNANQTAWDLFRAGVPMCIYGNPGHGKTEWAENLAKYFTEKTGEKWQTITLILSMLDYPDLNGFGTIQKDQNGQPVTVFAPPRSLMFGPNTILVLDEYSRCNQEVANAALQLLQKQRIGEHKLSSPCFIILTSNWGEDDKTTIRVIDPAEVNRVGEFGWSITAAGWVKHMKGKYGEQCAMAHIVHAIPDLINEDSGIVPFSTPRSLENVQKIISNYTPEELGERKNVDRLHLTFMGLVGPMAAKHIKSFLNACSIVSPQNVLDDYPKFRGEVKKMNTSENAAWSLNFAAFLLTRPKDFFNIKTLPTDAAKKTREREIKNSLDLIFDYRQNTEDGAIKKSACTTILQQIIQCKEGREDIKNHLRSDKRFVQALEKGRTYLCQANVTDASGKVSPCLNAADEMLPVCPKCGAKASFKLKTN